MSGYLGFDPNNHIKSEWPFEPYPKHTQKVHAYLDFDLNIKYYFFLMCGMCITSIR
jgi:hypothetical protein